MHVYLQWSKFCQILHPCGFCRIIALSCRPGGTKDEARSCLIITRFCLCRRRLPPYCCVGWEIDIDPDSLRRYQAMPGEMGERLRSYIDIEETPHFRLTADERCPLLNTNGLCDLITAAGQDALCQICVDHPRFRNTLSDREETGLGLCCEAAASLILKEKQPVRLLISEGSGPKRHLSRKDDAMLQKRDLWITVVQDRTLSIDARIARLMRNGSIASFPPVAGQIGRSFI